MNIYVTGHKSPDLDTVASAVVYSEFLTKLKRYEGAKIVPVLPGTPNRETQFVFEKFEVELPKSLEEQKIESSDAFVLVDHNEESQRHEKVVGEQVVEIVDHHKINLSFTTPIRIDVRPLGSTCTVIYEMFEMYGLEPSKKCKGLILAAILSDTQGLKSKLTTGLDSDYAHKLASELDLDIEKVTFDLFKAKSDITGLTTEEIATKDYKIFDFGGKKVLINQVETVEPQKILEMKEKLVDAATELKSKLGVAHFYLIVTDIMKINSKAIYTNDEEKHVLEKAFTGQGHENLIDIGPMMSRKKDIAPAIETAIIS